MSATKSLVLFMIIVLYTMIMTRQYLHNSNYQTFTKIKYYLFEKYPSRVLKHN